MKLEEIIPTVSVIIPTYNREKSIQKTIQSVCKQENIKYEIIVIDNGSTDNTVSLINQRFLNVIVIQNQKNLGTSIAKNQGILRARGKYLHFIDSDAELIKSACIRTMVDLLESNRDIGTLGSELSINQFGDIRHKEKKITFNCETITRVINSSDYELQEVDYVPTCNMMMRKELMVQCGGFDPLIFYAGEDKEIGIKVKKRGFRNIVDSRCAAYHYYLGSGRVSDYYLFNKNRLRILIKNGPWYKLVLLPIIDIFSLVHVAERLKSVRCKQIEATRWKINTDFSQKSFFQSINILGFNYLFALIKAYFWNLINLISTLSERMKQPNYLQEMENAST